MRGRRKGKDGRGGANKKSAEELNQMKQIGRRISAARKKKQLTQAQLAEKSNLSLTTISRNECGKQNSYGTTMGAIAKALGVSADFLLLGRTEGEGKADQ